MRQHDRQPSGLPLFLLFVGGLLLAPSASASESTESITLVSVDSEGAERPFTVQSTDVQGDISAGYASVVVTQTFVNPYDEALEAIYRFPLPHDAAVDRIGLIVGNRLIEAEIRPREEARVEYEAARDAGHRAALTEQKRPNVFEQSIANILPGQTVHITLHYAAPITYAEGLYTFAFPSVVGPRYLPAHTAVLQGADAGINPHFVAPSTPNPHRLSMQLKLRPGLPIFQVHSPSHTLDVQRPSREEHWLSLADPDAVPDRTVEVSYRLGTDAPLAGLVAHRKAGETGTFVLTVEPPADFRPQDAIPKEMIFVVDTSGSMMGEPLGKAKAAMRYALQNMGPQDAFQVVDFASSVSSLSPRPLANTPANVRRGLSFIERMSSAGGTEMLAGMSAALQPPADPNRLRIVCFMTDGYIGNDDEVLAFVRNHIGDARLFSFGVGEEVNRYLLDKMALLGRGAVQYVRLGPASNPVEQVVEQFYFRIGQPVLTDITVDWGQLVVTDMTPNPIPDLFAGQPLRVFGRYTQAGVGVAEIHAQRGQERVTIPIEVTLPETQEDHSVLEVMWARKQVDGLLSAGEWNDSAETVREVTALGLKYSILTRYTSFVAIERDIVANPTPENLRRALAAVHLPAGLRVEGLLGTQRRAQLTPNSIKPGDPEILVHAPREARRVVALLPWGQLVECAWEPTHSAWVGRFLVPREAEEGRYRVRVFIEDSEGDIDTLTLIYVVDASAPTMDLHLGQEEAAPGELVLLQAIPTEIVQAAAHGGPVVRFRSDVRRSEVVFEDQVLRLQSSDNERTWTQTLHIPEDLAPGTYEVVLVVTDMAQNIYRTSRWITVR